MAQPTRQPAEPLPSLFDVLPEQRRGEPPAFVLEPITAAARDALADVAVAGIHSTRWRGFINTGPVVDDMVHDAVTMPMPGCWAWAIAVRSRLGWISSHDYTSVAGGGTGGNSGRDPNEDSAGLFMWTSLEAALHAGACEMWEACPDPALADLFLAHFAAKGIDVTQPPGEGHKRRLVSREEVDRLRNPPSREEPAPEYPTSAPEPAKRAPRTIAEIGLGAGIVRMREPTVPDRVEIHTAIGEILPKGVPTYLKRIQAVNRKRGTTGGRIIADLVLFDDAVARVEISGQPGGRGYRWHSSGVEGTAFHWDDETRRWERIPEEP